ncbi:MAG TPA: hypothetical protein VFW04_02600 [Gemmatimonadaceae bacterium]|nr:hypothetical protein [Gemmatimonadaceae bacterium]HSC31556.1 hypothetical protein [Gemmatimonadaceae bacterium]
MPDAPPLTAHEPASNGPDAWDLPRAASFFGVSPRTLERWVARRVVPCIVYPPARVEEGTKGTKPIIAFDPDELAAWRDHHKVGRLKRAG